VGIRVGGAKSEKMAPKHWFIFSNGFHSRSLSPLQISRNIWPEKFLEGKYSKY